jgi:LacI family transcriptional regulator
VATISDVAALAGVSTATVSRALNGKSTVDPVLAERVARAVEELGYTPNGLARSLRRRETAVLALIISDVENPFFTAIARGVEDAAQAAGYSVMLCNSDENTAKERRYVEVAAQERLAGVIMSPTTGDSDVRPLTTHRTPIVTVDRRLASADCDAVLLDSRAAARDAVSHLVSQGYQRIGCIAGPPGVTTADDRLDGYRDGLREAGRKYAAKLVRRCEFREAGGREAATQLLTKPDPPDALLVSSSTMSVGVLQVMAELGLRARPRHRDRVVRRRPVGDADLPGADGARPARPRDGPAGGAPPARPHRRRRFPRNDHDDDGGAAHRPGQLHPWRRLTRHRVTLTLSLGKAAPGSTVFCEQTLRPGSRPAGPGLPPGS